MVTVLIPARNEEADIERCLRAVLAQDHPHDRMEVVLVDGGSIDRTAHVATGVLSAGDIDWKIIENPTGTTPSNLNAGLRVAAGDVICRVDARSIVPPAYVRLCAEVLTARSDIRVLGGAQIALARGDSVVARGIARGLNNSLAMGGARYRSRASSGPTDTVYLGAFRTDELTKAGGWNEQFATNQDYELNRRMAKCGHVWFEDRLAVQYLPRSQVSEIARQYFRFGQWKVRYWCSVEPPQPRQVALLAGAGSAAALAAGALIPPGRRCRRLALLQGVGIAGMFIVDARGSDSDADLSTRLVAGSTIAATTVGWVIGVSWEAFRSLTRAGGTRR